MLKTARMLAMACGFGLLVVSVVVLLGIGVTDYLVGPNLGNGLEGLAGEEFYSAQTALRKAQWECGGSHDQGRLVEWFFRHKFRVVELQMLDGISPSEGPEAAPAYRARVQAYTLFMIPTDSALAQRGAGDRSTEVVSCTDSLELDYCAKT